MVDRFNQRSDKLQEVWEWSIGEPAWVSSSCYTQWGQGSHQEHAAFFDFNNQLMIPGGIEFMGYDYGVSSNVSVDDKLKNLHVLVNGFLVK